MKTKLTTLAFILITLFSIISCDKDDISRTPVIPSEETMLIDFGNLANLNKSGSVAEVQILTKTNWLYAAATVGVWNAIIGTTFAVPVAAFKASFNQMPVKTADNVWEWAYSVDGFTSQYSARLVGTLQTSQVKWEMYISKSGIDSYDEFLWFEGTSDLDGRTGQWVLYHSAEFQEETVQIDWEKEDEEVGNIKYTYIRVLNDLRQTDKFNGSYLIYGLQDESFDAFVTIHAYDNQKNSFSDSFIEWSRSDFSGHVKAEHFFDDSEWHCWDSTGNDEDCN